MDTRGLTRLAAARMGALYLLSLLAAAGADLAWRPPDVGRLAAHAATLGFAVGLGSLLPDALSATGAAPLRARVRLVALLFLPLPGLLALAVAVAAPRLAGQAASALALLQVALLLLTTLKLAENSTPLIKTKTSNNDRTECNFLGDMNDSCALV